MTNQTPNQYVPSQHTAPGYGGTHQSRPVPNQYTPSHQQRYYPAPGYGGTH